MGIKTRAFLFPIIRMAKYEGNMYTHIGITEKITLAVNGGGGLSFDDLPQNALFELYYVEDRSIRSGYSLVELTAPQYLFGSAELRFDFVTFNVAHTVDCTVQGYIFSDVALLDDGDIQKNFVDAYGGGFRVLFDNPVFAYFTFAYGFNHEGRGRFSFCATAGF
jgi:hypothetical protein